MSHNLLSILLGRSARSHKRKPQRSRLTVESLEDRALLAVDFGFAAAMGGISSKGTAVDGVGNVYTTGIFRGTGDFAPGPETEFLTSAGSEDIFISKLDNAGNFLWAKRLGGSQIDEGEDIAVDGAGNVYITGKFSGTVDFDPGPGTENLTSAGAVDIFISKFDNSGNFLWAHGLGGDTNAEEEGSGIAVDGVGNVYTTGFFAGPADFDPGPGTRILSSNGIDIFVSKLDSAGNFIWAQGLGGSASTQVGEDIAVDGTGNVYTTGFFTETVDFDPGPGTENLTSVGSADIFISKLDSVGKFVWAKGFGGIDNDLGQGIAVDGAGNVYTTGSFRETADINPGLGTQNLTSAGDRDIFVSKLDSAGNFVWAQGLGGIGADEGDGITVDGTGNVFAIGSFSETVNFDPGAGTHNLTSAGAADIFISKFDSAGNLLLAHGLGSSDDDFGQDIAVDGAGNVYTTGQFRGTVDFDPGSGIHNRTSDGFRDIFVSKLTPPDTTAPVITLQGDNPQVSEAAAAYNELGATALDNVDGDISASIVIDSSAVDTATLGSYPVTYNVSDASGNAAAQVTRTVNVVDTMPPVITLQGDNPQTVEAGDAYIEQGATAVDAVDGDLTASIVIDASVVDTTTLSSYLVTYNVSDSSGNAAEATRTVNVVDTTPPETTIDSATDGEGVIISDGGSTLSEAIAFAFSSNEAGSTFECGLDGVAVACGSPQNYAGLSEGPHTFEVQATDAAGNTDPTPASFSWTVLTPVEAIEDLALAVSDLDLPKGIKNSLLRPLTGNSGAIDKLEDANPANDEAAIGKLQEFIEKVEAQRGTRLTDNEADALVAAVEAIIDDIREDLGLATLDEELLELLAS